MQCIVGEHEGRTEATDAHTGHVDGTDRGHGLGHRETVSAHQRFSASASNHPGRGMDVPCVRVDRCMMVPLASATTHFVLPVPMSRPSSSGLLTSHPALCST